MHYGLDDYDLVRLSCMASRVESGTFLIWTSMLSEYCSYDLTIEA